MRAKIRTLELKYNLEHPKKKGGLEDVFIPDASEEAKKQIESLQKKLAAAESLKNQNIKKVKDRDHELKNKEEMISKIRNEIAFKEKDILQAKAESTKYHKEITTLKNKLSDE